MQVWLRDIGHQEELLQQNGSPDRSHKHCCSQGLNPKDSYAKTFAAMAKHKEETSMKGTVFVVWVALADIAARAQKKKQPGCTKAHSRGKAKQQLSEQKACSLPTDQGNGQSETTTCSGFDELRGAWSEGIST